MVTYKVVDWITYACLKYWAYEIPPSYRLARSVDVLGMLGFIGTVHG